MKLGIDVGSGFTKYVGGNGEKGFFPSLVARLKPETPRPFGFEEADIIAIKGPHGEDIEFIVGESVKGVAPEDRENTLQDDWAGSPPWFALLYYAMSQVAHCLTPSEPVLLSTGLPMALYENKSLRLQERLVGKHTFKINGEPYIMIITPEIIPQAVAALLSTAQDDEENLKETVGIIDIGTYTTGFAVMDEGSFVPYRSGGIAMGIHTLLNHFHGHLVRVHGHNAAPENVLRILQKGFFMHRGAKVDVSDEIPNVVENVIGVLVNNIEKTWRSADDLKILIAGGGGPFFFDALQKKLEHATLMRDGFFSVAKGLFKHQEIIAEAAREDV